MHCCISYSYILLQNHYYVLLHHYFIIITSLLHHYYIVITTLLHYYYIIITFTIITLLLHQLLLRIITIILLRIITSLLRHYYVIITSLLQNGNHIIMSALLHVMQMGCLHYYVIITQTSEITHYYTIQSPELADGVPLTSILFVQECIHVMDRKTPSIITTYCSRGTGTQRC